MSNPGSRIIESLPILTSPPSRHARRVALPFTGQRRVPAEPTSAIVVGGGLAGLAAAVVLAERGVQVTVLERERYLGGRAGAWTDQLQDGTVFEMERGFHAFFRQYYNLRQLLRRVDPELGFPQAHHRLPDPDTDRQRVLCRPHARAAAQRGEADLAYRNTRPPGPAQGECASSARHAAFRPGANLRRVRPAHARATIWTRSTFRRWPASGCCTCLPIPASIRRPTCRRPSCCRCCTSTSPPITTGWCLMWPTGRSPTAFSSHWQSLLAWPGRRAAHRGECPGADRARGVLGGGDGPRTAVRRPGGAGNRGWRR